MDRCSNWKEAAVLPFTAVKKIWGRNEAGVSLIETLIALALLGMIAAPFLSGLATASKSTFIADERATAESLARSQMEHVKGQSYIDYAEPGHDEYGLIATPANYSVEITTVPIDADTGQTSGEDNGIQKISVTVKHYDEPLLMVETYKVAKGG